MSDRTGSSDFNQTASLNVQSSACSMLRPSLFSSNLKSNLSESTGNEATIDATKRNPFLKECIDEERSETVNNSESDETKKNEKDKLDPLSLLTKQTLPKSNLFSVVKSSIPVEDSGFVFGQNVHERVVGENIKSIQDCLTTERASSVTNENNDNKTNSELLFANAIQNSNNKVDKEPVKNTENKSLTDVAREYEESRAQKRKYEEVETFTGEENEKNIFDISCKLFAFVNSNWEERGRGSLRLNDSKEQQEVSRVVFRTSGNLRLLLNTKIWPDMIAERPSPKSLRLTAMDNNGQIKIFLAMSRPDDINIIYNALSKRINILKESLENDSDSIKENQKKNDEENQEKATATEPSPKKLTLELQN